MSRQCCSCKCTSATCVFPVQSATGSSSTRVVTIPPPRPLLAPFDPANNPRIVSLSFIISGQLHSCCSAPGGALEWAGGGLSSWGEFGQVTQPWRGVEDHLLPTSTLPVAGATAREFSGEGQLYIVSILLGRAVTCLLAAGSSTGGCSCSSDTNCQRCSALSQSLLQHIYEMTSYDWVDEVGEVGVVGEELPESHQESLLKVSSLTRVTSVKSLEDPHSPVSPKSSLL